jgi:hypothetical protein
MNAPEMAREESCLPEPADHPIQVTDAPDPSPGIPGGGCPLDLAEVMPSVGRVVLGLARGAELFLDRIQVDSPSFVPHGDPSDDSEDDSDEGHDRTNADNRFAWQRRDSVEAARLANVLARLLERYRIGLRDLTEAGAPGQSRPGRRK